MRTMTGQVYEGLRPSDDATIGKVREVSGKRWKLEGLKRARNGVWFSVVAYPVKGGFVWKRRYW